MAKPSSWPPCSGAAHAFEQALLADLTAAEELSPTRADARALYRIRVLFTAWHRFAVGTPHLHRLLDTSLSDPQPNLPDPIALKVDTSLVPLFTLAARLQREAVDAGALAPGHQEIRTRAMWAAFHGVEHFCKRDRVTGPDVASAAIRSELFRALLSGWGASSSALALACTAELPLAPVRQPPRTACPAPPPAVARPCVGKAPCTGRTPSVRHDVPMSLPRKASRLRGFPRRQHLGATIPPLSSTHGVRP